MPNCSIKLSEAAAWSLEVMLGFIRKPLILVLPEKVSKMEVTTT
jgi:hypothetical protein